jgi:signal transduction histidine kinase
MTATTLLQYIIWLLFGFIFVRVLHDAIRQPTRSTIDIALFFGALALVFFNAALSQFNILPSSRALALLNTVLVLSLSYLVIRLVADFMPTPPMVLWLAGALFVISSVSMAVFPPPRPTWLTLLIVIAFVSFQLYAAAAFFRARMRSTGVTRRRMQAVTLGSTFLGAAVLMAGLQFLAAGFQSLAQVFTLLSGFSYYIGFAPPDILRRAWQEPELRAFLGRAAALPRLPTTQAILQSIADGAAAALGVDHSTIGLWDAAAQLLRFPLAPELPAYPLTANMPALDVLRTQQAGFTPAFFDPTTRQTYAIVAAPITAGEQRLGVLVAYTTSAPIFASEDVALLRLLADQAAVILESRALIDEAARVQAREHVTRLKDDFLSAAAHDLKTPLTTLVGRTQLLERQIMRSPTKPIDLAAIQTLVREAQRLKRLVQELLDAGRAEQGQLVGVRAPINLSTLAEAVRGRHDSARHPCTLEAEAVVMATVDEPRIAQLLENLVENAVKYSPDGGAIAIRVWHTDQQIHLTIADHGIGIPPSDRAHIFERFHRGRNVDDRRFAGMGLGLYLCHAIVEQHAGQISVADTIPQGTTFHIVLPQPEGAPIETPNLSH